MVLRILRFITLILIALWMGLEFSHTLELPPKMQYDGQLYVTVQNTLYQYFGAPGPGAIVTVGAFVSAIALLLRVRKRRPAFCWTLIGTLCLGLAFPVVYFWQIEPVNVVFRQATPQSLPTNWMQLRQQWEYGHLTNFVLTLFSFSTLLISVLVETSTNRRYKTKAEELTNV
jgi:ABC-type xylose transport system permease subunit